MQRGYFCLMPVFLLDTSSVEFPPVELARADGLLAVGGDLRAERLLRAYKHGIFPWYNEGEPILWWSPDPRLVLFPSKLHVSRRLARVIRQRRFDVTCNLEFRKVMELCGLVRKERGEGTWINPQMLDAYCRLHDLGYGISVESWYQGELVGGLYGILFGSVFFGESMFAIKKEASKVAFVHMVKAFCQRGLRLVDCQVETGHLKRFGAQLIPRSLFNQLLDKWTRESIRKVSPGPLPID